jgi:hypothetical protein
MFSEPCDLCGKQECDGSCQSNDIANDIALLAAISAEDLAHECCPQSFPNYDVQPHVRRLLIDDRRYDKEDIYGIPLCDAVARTAALGVQLLLDNNFTELYLDHDLGNFPRLSLLQSDNAGLFVTEATIPDNGPQPLIIFQSNGTGIVNMMEAAYKMANWQPPKVVVLVTDNGAGRVQMGNGLESMGYTFKEGRFVR